LPLEFAQTALPLLVAFLTVMVVAPGVIAALTRHKVGQTIQKDGPESHFSKAGTPTMGGIVILVGILVGLAAALFVMSRINPEFLYYNDTDKPVAISPYGYLIALLALVLGYAVVGLVDDYLTIKPIRGVRGIASKPKAAIQFILAACFVLWLRHVGFEPVLYVAGKQLYFGETYWLLAAVFISGMANFVNITDGLDGLVSGLVAIACTGLAFTLAFAYVVQGAIPVDALNGAAVLTPVILATIGACVGFLWYNANPARVFMGDTGSLAIGVLLPGIAIIMHLEILMIVLGLVFVLDGFSTIIQWAVFKFTRITTGTGRRVFLKSPVHHHFELMGWPEQTVVVRFWICGVIAAMLGYAGVTLGWW